MGLPTLHPGLGRFAHLWVLLKGLLHNRRIAVVQRK